MSRKECKDLAKSILKNNWAMAFVVMLIYLAVISLLSTLSFGIGTLLLSSVALIAVYKVFINAYNNKGYHIQDMVAGIDEGISNRICLSCLKMLYIFLWSLLFIIPGIVKMYSYYLAEFISLKNPNKTATECLDESKKLMQGHKFELFVFQLSFIGWQILSCLTFGILYIWVGPYIMQTTIVYIDKNIYQLSTGDENIVEGEAYSEECKYCRYCGKQLSTDARYCDSCGKEQ